MTTQNTYESDFLDTEDAKPAQIKQLPYKVIAASTLGTALEFYDFIVYGTVAALVFNKIFFPMNSPSTGLLLALSTFAAGFLARPIGAAIFGHVGDRVGRKVTLQVTLMMMGLATIGIACLPTYQQIGVAAPILLVVLRVIQGAAVGGEWGGAVLLLTEYADPKKRGWASCFAQLGSPAGTLIANAVVLVTITSMPSDLFLAWGWRIPFALGGMLLLVGWYMRKEVEETPVFLKMKKERKVITRSPVVSVFKDHGKRLLTAMGVGFVTFGGYYLFTTVSLAYLASKQLPAAYGLYGSVIGAAVALPVILISGRLSDIVGRKPLYTISAVGIAIWGFVLFPLFDSGSEIAMVLAITVGLFFWAIAYGVQGAFLPELFPASVRYSGASLSYQITGAIGGVIPLVATSLLAWSGSTMSISILVCGIAIVSLVAIYVAPETLHQLDS
ncbi:MFS transporter [Pseudomonas tolaasii]